MKKKWLFLVPTVLLLGGCAIERLSNVIAKGTDGMATPSWNIDFDVPLGKVEARLSEIKEVNEMLRNLKFTDDTSIKESGSALIHAKIDGIEIKSNDFTVDENVKAAIGADSVLTWPLPIGKLKTPKIQDTTIPVIKLDIDNKDGQDIMLTKLKSKDGYLKIKLQMQFLDSNGNFLRNATEDDYFDEEKNPYIAIEDVTGDYSIEIGDKRFSFEKGVYEEDKDKDGNTVGKLVFKTKNFLTDYENSITPTKAWKKDENGKFVYEDDNVTHVLDDANYEYRISIPENVLRIYGESFSLIEDVMGEYPLPMMSSRSVEVRGNSDGKSKLTPEEIQTKVQNAKDVSDIEKMLTEDNVGLDEIAEAYDNNLDKLLGDVSGDISVKDILTSEIIASDENIEILGRKENGFGMYELIKGVVGEDEEKVTLEKIHEAGNLKSLSAFCRFYDKQAVQGIRFNFEIEVDLGDTFVITGEFIDDYEVAVDTSKEDPLPLSMLDKVLENATLAADISHNFIDEIKIKSPKIGDKEIDIKGIGSADSAGYYTIPGKSCQVEFNLDEMPSEDGAVALSVLIPKNKAVDIALEPKGENDLWIKMFLGVNGTLKVAPDEISGLLGGE